MKINSIVLENYRGFQALTVEFDPMFNAIVGVNGSGKTSLLKAVCDAFGDYTHGLSHMPRHHFPLGDANVAHLKVDAINGRARFAPQYPVKVTAEANAFGQACSWNLLKTSEVSGTDIAGKSPINAWREAERSVVAESYVTLPILAFYRASRDWDQASPSEISAASMRNSRIDGYFSWWDASVDAPSLQSWIIGKCLERFQTSSETGQLFDDIDTDELALVNRALGRAVEGIKGLKYDLTQKSLIVEWRERAGMPARSGAFENLSDGQRASVCLIVDIARRMCLLNPQLGEEVTSATPGIVLIDELDMHLHPGWQRVITRGLKSAFPSVQFIVASHSPQVLGELSADEIIMLRPEGPNHPQVSYGLTSDQVLEEIMGAPSRNAEVESALTAAYQHLERNELGLARAKIQELQTIAAGIPELVGAEALLRRKEALGR